MEHVEDKRLRRNLLSTRESRTYSKFVFKVSRARVINNKNRGGFIDRARSPMFSKRTKTKIIKQRLCTG